jgi:hypothetical protein
VIELEEDAVSISRHPDMLELQKRQGREAAEAYEEYLRLHPELEGHLDGADWPAHHTVAFREFSALLLARHKEERRALVIQLGGKFSALTEFELSHR